SRQSTRAHMLETKYTRFQRYFSDRSRLLNGVRVGEMGTWEYLSIGKYVRNLSDPRKALEMLITGYQAAKAEGPASQLAEFALELGRTYSLLGELDSATYYLHIARSIVEEQEESEPIDLVNVHESIGNVRFQSGDIPNAITSYRRAARIRNDQLGESVSLANHAILHRGGVMLLESGVGNAAIRCLDLAIKKRRQLSSEPDLELADMLHSLSRAAVVANDLPLAMRAADESESIYKNTAGEFADRRIAIRIHQLRLTLAAGNIAENPSKSLRHSAT
ncbi:MAG: tetratricopeptide (TPR) repeat protein, partial [Pirellulaceae bacterium]